MDTPLPDRPQSGNPTDNTFGALTDVLYAADTFDEVYGAIVRSAVALVDGCDHASIMQRGRDGRFTTAVASDDIGAFVDRLERQHSQGPCLDAIVEDTPQFEDDLSRPDCRWPELARDVVDQTPVRSAAGFRIVVGGEKIGALNLFSDRVGGIKPTSADSAIILAAFASVAVSSMHNKRQASTLSSGLESNREIGKAIGLLMAFHRVSDSEAFDLLRKASQDMNIKLAEVAREVVDHHNKGYSTVSA